MGDSPAADDDSPAADDDSHAVDDDSHAVDMAILPQKLSLSLRKGGARLAAPIPTTVTSRLTAQGPRGVGTSGWWSKSELPPLESCSLTTTNANKLAAKVHDRMP